MAQGDGYLTPYDDDYYLLPDAAYSNRRSHNAHDDDSSYRFFPPLYRQRYAAVIQEVKKYSEFVDKVADFGCAEGSFLHRARGALTQTVHTLVGVDIDEKVLERAETALTPSKYSYYYNDCCLNASPATTYLYKGSIAEYDDRLAGTDCVTAIELIEHLHDDVLRGAVDMIFGRIHPYLVIFTTPNVEFNVLFNMGDRQFRHYDHKFEWTREEFQKWCDAIIAKYPKYSVEFSGMGAGPEGTEESLGYASQMAVFRWKRKSSYVKRRGERSREFCDMVGACPNFFVRHMTGEIDTHADGQKHEHPYQFVARIKMPSEAAERRARRRAVYDCQDYCRKIYIERLERYNENGAVTDESSLIITDPETGIKGTWFDVKELYDLFESVRDICDDPSDLGSLLAFDSDTCFISDGGGFSYVCKRVMYQDEDDLCVYRARMQENSDGDEYEYGSYDGEITPNNTEVADEIATTNSDDADFKQGARELKLSGGELMAGFDMETVPNANFDQVLGAIG